MTREKNRPNVSPVLTHYGWKASTPPDSQDYLSPLLLSILQNEPPGRILDLGCGNGALCRLLNSQGIDVVGMEPDADGVCIAREQLPSISFYQIGVDDDPCSITAVEGLFDAVVSTEVIEHLYSPHLLPSFARCSLKPGGLLIVTTPYHGYLKNIFLSLAGKWDHHHTALWHGGHIKFWSRATLTKLLETNGFVVERFHGVGRLPWLWKSMILVARRSIA
jgi:2-polyprenyl-3-methyl-5-hydroxy-6-metoxy-1,4-benzoquinol methylase